MSDKPQSKSTEQTRKDAPDRFTWNTGDMKITKPGTGHKLKDLFKDDAKDTPADKG